jgi:putative peptidoglycan lipid II flippase
MVARELIVAWKFGTGDELDAFFIAWIVPSFLVNLVAGSFNVAFIPTYIRVRDEEGTDAAQRLFDGTTAWSLALLVLVAFLAVVLAPWYLPRLTGNFSPAKFEMTYRLFCLLAPLVVLSGLITIWGAVLNAGERFAFAAAASILTPLFGVICFLAVPAWGISGLAVGTVGGALLEAAMLGVALSKAGVSIVPRWYGIDSHLRQVIGQYAPMITGSFLMSSTVLVDGAMAANLEAGSVAALNYGNRVVGMVVSLSTVALGTAVMPYFSSIVAREDWNEIRHILGRSIRLVLGFGIPLTLFLIVFSQPLVKVLFQRGSFTGSDTREVAVIQSLLALQIPCYCAGIPIVRAISALRANHILMWGCLLNLISNITLNIIFMRWWGVAGIALSTSVMYINSFLFCWYMLNRQIKKMNLQNK